jgi:hypothetical protein
MTQPLEPAHVPQLRAALLASEQEFRADWLAQGDKIAVPFEPPLKISDEFAARICAAFAIGGHDIAWGLHSQSWEGMRPHEGIVVPLDPASVIAWHDEFMPFDMVLTAPDGSRAALFTQDEFGIIAGSAPVVEAFLGTTVTEARRAFSEYAEDMAKAAHHLPGLAHRYGCF